MTDESARPASALARRRCAAPPVLAVLALLTVGGLAGAACGGSPSTPTAGDVSTTTAPPSDHSAAAVRARLVATLHALEDAASTLHDSLGRMQSANDAGTTYSRSDVASATSDLVEQLQLAATGLQSAQPTLPPAAAAQVPSLAASLSAALGAFRSTDNLDATSTNGLPPGLSSNLLSAAAGGPLIAQYLGDLSPVTTIVHDSLPRFLAALGGAPNAGSG